MGVSAATISRELARNRPTDTTQPYQAPIAQACTKQRRQRQAYKLKDTLKEDVLKRLRERFSPEQISGVLALETGRKCISHETIYRYYYTHNDTGVGQSLTKFLRIRHKKRYKQRGKPQKRGTIPHRVGIEQRPAIVETNTQVGHWEGDTVIGAEHDGVLLTAPADRLVERVTKYTIIVKLPSKHALFLAHQAVIHLNKCPLPVASIRFDNGKEFTDHRLIRQGVKAPVYFARPCHSWERGLNENTNAGRPVPTNPTVYS